MKRSQILAMQSRIRAERHERFDGYKSRDIPNMNDRELGDYLDWLAAELLTATGPRYAHLDLLDDMALDERSKR